MAPMMRRRFDDEDDDGPYDKRYPGRKVVADGGRVRVPVMLTESLRHTPMSWKVRFSSRKVK